MPATKTQDTAFAPAQDALCPRWQEPSTALKASSLLQPSIQKVAKTAN